MAARNALLKYLRVSVRPVLPFQSPGATGGGLSQLIRRHFCEEAKGSFLDKSEVADRVINVVKNFQKVDPSKVFSVVSSSLFYRGFCVFFFFLLFM